MADIAIDTGVTSHTYQDEMRGGIHWRSISIGYIIFIDNSSDLCYRKTADKGATWGSKVVIKAGTVYNCDSWADWHTPDDAGTKIHVVYLDIDTDDARYIYLDTSTDTVAGDDQIEACQGTTALIDYPAWDYQMLSITKLKGGNLAVAIKYFDDGYTAFVNFYTSPDGDAWTVKTSPWDGEQPTDRILLFPGNEADTQDLWAIFWDTSASEISLKVFDDSGNSWSETSIASSMVKSGTYVQMDGSIRHSDGHLIFAAWSKEDDATSDLMIWDINGAGSITAKTNIITDTTEYAQCSVFINQVNDDIYVAYLGGTAWASLVDVHYQLSEDGAGTWGGEVGFSVDTNDDHRWISAGCMKASLGGRFMPAWFDDDQNNLYTNFDNSIEIAAEVPAGAAGIMTTNTGFWGPTF